MNPEISTVTYLPPCYTKDGQGRSLVTDGLREYWVVDNRPEPVYVRIGGRRREAKRWLWLWRMVAWAQGEK